MLKLDKKVIKFFLWIFTIVCIVWYAILQFRVSHLTGNIVYNIDESDIKSFIQFFSDIVCFFSVFVNWVVISEIILFFVDEIDDIGFVTRKEIYFPTGFYTFVSLISSFIVIYTLNRVWNEYGQIDVTDFYSLKEYKIIKIIQNSFLAVYYLAILLHISIKRQFGLIQILKLFLIFAIIYVAILFLTEVQKYVKFI